MHRDCQHIVPAMLGSVEWIQLAQHRYWWGVLMNTVMNFRVLTPWNLLMLVQGQCDCLMRISGEQIMVQTFSVALS
jgi:hypothetical protein